MIIKSFTKKFYLKKTHLYYEISSKTNVIILKYLKKTKKKKFLLHIYWIGKFNVRK